MQYQQNEWQRHGKKWRTNQLSALSALYGDPGINHAMHPITPSKHHSEKIYPLEMDSNKEV